MLQQEVRANKKDVENASILNFAQQSFVSFVVSCFALFTPQIQKEGSG